MMYLERNSEISTLSAPLGLHFPAVLADSKHGHWGLQFPACPSFPLSSSGILIVCTSWQSNRLSINSWGSVSQCALLHFQSVMQSCVVCVTLLVIRLLSIFVMIIFLPLTLLLPGCFLNFFLSTLITKFIRPFEYFTYSKFFSHVKKYAKNWIPCE